MSSINLNVVGAETFGARLPTVFIQSIEVDTPGGDSGYDNRAKITATLSIKFTKPRHLDESHTQEFFRSYLEDLTLYAYITTDDPQWAEALENEALDLLQWFPYVEGLENEGILGGSGSLNPKIAYENKLKDLVEGDDGAILILNNSFDGEGNEIIEISNITCEFTYSGSVEHTGGLFDTPLKDVEKLFLFAMVGLPRNDIENDNFTDTYMTPGSEGVLFGRAKTVSSQTYNSFFGNITYYQVLEGASTASRYYSQYSRPDGSPYLEFVLQSINGKFYSTDNYGYTDLKAAFEATIAEFSAERASDSILNKNISDLEAIILGEHNRTNMLGEIANYSSTYPNKDQNTASGRFFNSFVVTYAEVLQVVQSQEELSQKLYLDSLVTDNRQGGLIGTYSAPNPRAESGYMRGTSIVPSEHFIPRRWFQIERKAWSVLPLTDSTVWGSAYISADAMTDSIWGGPEATIAGLSVGETEFSSMIEEFKDHYIEEGYPADIAEEMAREEVEYQLSSGDTGTAGELLGSPTSLEDMEDLNFIVRNKGYFFFDYEKALRTQSAAAQVLNLTKIQQYFRKGIPYEYFFLDFVELQREELYVGMAGVASSASSIKCKIFADFKVDGKYASYDGDLLSHRPPLPRQRRTGLSWEHEHVEAADSFMEAMDVYRFRYLRPVAKSTDLLGTELYSYLKFKNFDVASADRTKRLDGHNDLGVEVSYDGLGPVLDGYRLMCFEFSDLMDDDVAYYNASHEGLADDEDRRENLAALNNIDAESTVYKMKVRCIDFTRYFVEAFYDHCLAVYENYEEYSTVSADICSFNNLTNSYNQFFVDAINEKYADTKPWIEAAYTVVALSDIMFNPEMISEDSLNTKVMNELMKIAPSTGTLESTLNFKETFAEILSYLGPVWMAGGPELSPRNRLRDEAGSGASTDFYNQIDFGGKNLGPIYGDFFPDITGPDSFSPREGAPVIVIPRAAYMGGREDYITNYAGGERKEGTDMTKHSLYAGVVGDTAYSTYDRAELDAAWSDTAGEQMGVSDGKIYISLLSEVDEEGLTHAETTWATETIVTYSANAWVDIINPSESNIVQIAYDEIFLPYSGRDWRARALDLTTGTSTSTYHAGDHALATQETIERRLKERPELDMTMGDVIYSCAGKWAHEILMRSSVDAEINADGTRAKRRASGNSPTARRSRRALVDLLYIINYFYLPEARRRIAEEDTTRYSLVVRIRQNFEGIGLADTGYAAGGLSTVNTHKNIETALELMKDRITAEINDPTNNPTNPVDGSDFEVNVEASRSFVTLGGGAFGGWAYGISAVVSMDDYPGDSNFVSTEAPPWIGHDYSEVETWALIPGGIRIDI